jgi:hypothetical protein
MTLGYGSEINFRKARSGVAAEQAAKVTPFAAGNEATVRKSAAGDFFQINESGGQTELP